MRECTHIEYNVCVILILQLIQHMTLLAKCGQQSILHSHPRTKLRGERLGDGDIYFVITTALQFSQNCGPE